MGSPASSTARTLARPGQPDLHYTVDDWTDPWAEAPWLFLQHGYCRSGAFWYQWVPHLARHFRVVRPDMRGVGQSGRFDFATLTLDVLIDDVVAIAAALGVTSLHYCGESLGGIVGMGLASRRPELVRALALVSTPARIAGDAQERYALGHGSIVAAIEAVGIEAWVRATTASTRFPPDAPPGMVDWFCRSLAAAGPEAHVEYTRFLQTADATPLLAGIRAPVLSLYPQAGGIASDAQKQVLQQHIRDIRFVHLPTRAHMIQHLMPGQCARQVLQFCAAVDGRICEE